MTAMRIGPDGARAALKGLDLPNTGTGRHAAMLVTPSMLLYTGEASGDIPSLFAVDKTTGKRLSQVPTPDLGRYGLMTYSHEGKQYVVLQVNGSLVAMALP